MQQGRISYQLSEICIYFHRCEKKLKMDASKFMSNNLPQMLIEAANNLKCFLSHEFHEGTLMPGWIIHSEWIRAIRVH